MAARPLYSSMAFKGNDVGDGDNDSQDDLMWNDEGSSQASSPRLETDAGHQAPSPCSLFVYMRTFLTILCE